MSQIPLPDTALPNIATLPDWAWDICWMDCPEPGRRISYLGKEICLCARHRAVLADGMWGNTYDGAPLPPDSQAAAWPWRDTEEKAA